MFYLPYYSMRNFFSPLVHHIESLFLTGKPPYPIQRTLLTTGIAASPGAAVGRVTFSAEDAVEMAKSSPSGTTGSMSASARWR